MATNPKIKTEQYWDKNIFASNKYRPLFMISNKEIYKLVPEKKQSVFERFSAPTVYSISLKGSSIKRISLSSSIISSANTKKAAKIEQKSDKKNDLQSISLFEQVKGKDVDTDKKMDVAILLRNTKKTSNYDLAIDLLDEITNEEPYNVNAFNLKGDIYLVKNDKEKAMKNYTEALKINPYSQQSCIGIARILEPTDKELAQKYYAKAKELQL